MLCSVARDCSQALALDPLLSDICGMCVGLEDWISHQSRLYSAHLGYRGSREEMRVDSDEIC